MLELIVEGQERYDEKNNLFYTTKSQKLSLEHSLVSISKWESKWKKSFLNTKNLSMEEMIDYIRCMTINNNVDSSVYRNLNNSHIQKINDYINDPMTATTFSNQKTKGSREIVTAELIYYWMIALQIPMECQKWHLNRLLTLIEVANIKNTPPKKMSKHEIMKRNSAINNARRMASGSKG